MDTNPEVEVTEQSPESMLEAQFAKRYGEEKPEPEAVEVEEEEVSDDEPEAEAPAEEEELADYDIAGFTVKVPKSKAEAAQSERMMQADYTRKTQELARQREVVDLQAKQVQLGQQAQSVLFEKAAALRALDAELERYNKADWNSIAQQDSGQAIALMAHRDALKSQREQQISELQQIQTQFAREHEANEAQWKQKLEALGTERLTKELGGWDGKRAGETAQFLIQEAGYQQHELAGTLAYDPRFIRMAYEAKQWRELQKSKAGAIEKKVSAAKPFVPPAARSGQAKHADSKAQDLRNRMTKTGKASDVQAFLEAKFMKAAAAKRR